MHTCTLHFYNFCGVIWLLFLWGVIRLLFLWGVTWLLIFVGCYLVTIFVGCYLVTVFVRCYLVTIFASCRLITETPAAPSITVSPSTFDFNDAVTLTCDPATAGSSYTYVWSRDGTTLSETGSQLSIGSFAAGDTGTYTCAVVDQGITSPVSAGTTVTASCKFKIQDYFIVSFEK